jgi:ethanolamine utilization protein EutA
MHDFDGYQHYHDDSGAVIAGQDDEIIWKTVGVDIGSSTSQLVFSLIILARDDARYVVVRRSILHQSEVILTPYSSPEIINAKRLASFIDDQYRQAGLTRDEIDTGAVILTGLALSTSNSRAIAEAIADDSGRFVAISAGDVLEARLAASGAGIAAISADQAGLIVHIDIGGGTTKLSAWQQGKLLGLAAIDVGARLVTFDQSRRVVRIEAPCEPLISKLKSGAIKAGEIADQASIEALCGVMAEEVLRYAGIHADAPRWPHLLRTPPLFKNHHHDHDHDHSDDHHEHGHENHDHSHHPARVDGVIFTGGVSEYVYGRETEVFGDLGLPLGQAIRARLKISGVSLIPFERGIRATVLGVSQHSIQLSGNTIFVSDPALLPLRNVPVLLPALNLSADELNAQDVADAIALSFWAINEGVQTQLAIAIPWQGSATFARLSILAEVLVQTLSPRLKDNDPIIVIVDGDIAGVLGSHLSEAVATAVNGTRGVICLDSVSVNELDHIDIGAMVPKTRALPVAIKSLLFSTHS